MHTPTLLPISGSSNFNIKGFTRRLIVTRKGDFKELCDFCAQQTDSPVNVMT